MPFSTTENIACHMSLIMLVCFHMLQVSFSLLIRNGAQLVDQPDDFKLGQNYRNIQSGQNSSVHDWHRHDHTLQACSDQSLQQLTTGHWFIDAKGHYLYEPATCILRRMSGEDARRYAIYSRQVVMHEQAACTFDA